MGEFTIQCTMCDTSFGSEAEYNVHGCSGEDDLKFPAKIKLEPEDNDDREVVERALLDFASSTGEFDIEQSDIKAEPLEIEMTEDVIDEDEKLIDPLSFTTEFENNEDEPKKEIGNEENPDLQNEFLHETETFTERYTKSSVQGEADSKNSKTKMIRNNYTCSCKLCNSVFSKKEDFTKHFREDHKSYRYRPYECSICGKKFLHKHYVNLHMRVHTGEKPYVCKLCPRSYSHKTSFTIHMRIHNGERPYSCGICGKKCYDKSGLTSHMRSHTKETPYQCEICGRRFTHSKSLLVHRRNHTGEKPYVCSFCGKAFRHWHKHKIHVRLHTGERPYKCKICGKGFPRNDEVSRHMRSHQGIKSFKCSICGVYCATQASITGHINLHHSNLKTEMEPPPEKTLVKNSNSGILGTKVPEPRSIYRTAKLNGVLSVPSTSKANNISTSTKMPSGNQTEGKTLSTRVIEVTSKDTPITLPTKLKTNGKKLNCILPKSEPTSNTSDSKENDSMTYQEFLEWQERMLTNQGLVVKGYSSSKENATVKEDKTTIVNTTSNSSLKATSTFSIAKDQAKNKGGLMIHQNSVQPASAVGKPQYLLLSQGTDGNVTKILLPLNIVGQNRNITPTIGLPSAVHTTTSPASQVTGQQQTATRPVFLLPQNVSNQPLLLVSSGGQKMLLMSPHMTGRSATPSTPIIASPQTDLSKIVIKEEPRDPSLETSDVSTTMTIKTEPSTPPHSPVPPISPQIRIKEEF